MELAEHRQQTFFLEMVNKWYEATDNLDSYVHVVMLDFSKAFDLINHCMSVDRKITAV